MGEASMNRYLAFLDPKIKVYKNSYKTIKKFHYKFC